MRPLLLNTKNNSMKTLVYLMVGILLVSCSRKQSNVTNSNDYNTYLTTGPQKTTSKFFELWNSKIDMDSTQLLSFANVAGEYHRFFEATGEISFLKKAEKASMKALEIANINQSAYARAMARNYISQHRFKEALEMAKLADDFGGGKVVEA